MMKKKLCVITATRAEYSFLKPLVAALKQRDNVTTQLIVTGTHLEKKYGNTIQEIIDDGFTPDASVRIIENDSSQGILLTMSNAIKKVGQALQRLSPDMVVLLGDRYEALSIASACVILNIPVAHISGGDITYGAYDDMFRHALTKLSYLHFVSCEEYRQRVIQLGENPNRVFMVGSLSVENLLNAKLFPKRKIEKQIGFPLENSLLATFHPVTMERMSQKQQFKELLLALQGQKRYNIVFTRPNADADRSELDQMLNNFAKENHNRVKIVDSLGVVRYLSVMKYCAGVIGNSSSGILEAPSLRVGTINIGNRQEGRLCARSVIHCQAKKAEILKALDLLASDKFQNMLKNVKNFYAQKNTSLRIARTLEGFVYRKPKIKEFYDLEVKNNG